MISITLIDMKRVTCSSFAFVALLAVTGCGSKDSSAGGTASAPPKRAFVAVPSKTIQGKWLSIKKLGGQEMRSTYEFGADGKFKGEMQLRPNEKHVEAGTYTYKDDQLTRSLTLNQMHKAGKIEKLSNIKLTTPMAWYSNDEFVFVGNEDAVWKRQP
jgi:hypothetical protein